MNTISQPKQWLRMTVETRVSAYDRVSGFLLAGIVVLSLLVLLLFMIWLTGARDFSSRIAATMFEPPTKIEDQIFGFADDWDEPGLEEFPEVERPLVADMQAATAVISRVQDQLNLFDALYGVDGDGSGLGDDRRKGVD